MICKVLTMRKIIQKIQGIQIEQRNNTRFKICGVTKTDAQSTRNQAIAFRALSHPLNVTTQSVQQNAKHVIATATFRNIIISKCQSKRCIARKEKTG
jgi:3-hydroxymyristoyl/3-hydroxydecanoyl-(acyl carrier protein) dehydratase